MAATPGAPRSKRLTPEDDEPEEHENNTFELPDGKPLKGKLKKLFDAQAQAILGTIPDIGAPLPDAFPALADWDDPMARACTPILSAYWDVAGGETWAKLGLDPDEWRVTDPHLEAKIRASALDFCEATNRTTHLALETALEKLRDELVQGLVKEGDSIPQLRKRVQSVFTELDDSRAERIARTEASRAVHQASLESATASGVVAGKKWLISANSCDLCKDLAAKADEAGGLPLEGSFGEVSDHPVYGDVKMPPAHPYCRCSVTYVLTAEYEDILAKYGPPKPTIDPGPLGPEPKERTIAKPKPEPKAKPAAPPVPVKTPRELARDKQRIENAAAAKKDKAYAANLKQFPDLLPPGPIQDRIAKYRAGDEKVKELLALGAQHEPEATKLASELRQARDDWFQAIGERKVHESRKKATPANWTAADDAKLAAVKTKEAAAKQAHDAIDDRNEAFIARRAAAVAELLKVDQPTTFAYRDLPAGFVSSDRKLLHRLKGDAKARAEAASEWLGKVTAVGDSADVQARWGGRPKGDRAHFVAAMDYVQLADDSKTKTAVHELGHVMEEKLKTAGSQAVDRGKEFLDHRVGSETAIDLHAKFGRGRPGEKGRKDRFDTVFDEYPAYYTGKAYPDATEILSMGTELLYNDPLKLAKNDPEYCKYVLGMLDGSLR